MGHWNYRIVERGGAVCLHEVYYDDTGRISGWIRDPATPSSESPNGLRWVLTKMATALKKSVLVEDGEDSLREKGAQ